MTLIGQARPSVDQGHRQNTKRYRSRPKLGCRPSHRASFVAPPDIRARQPGYDRALGVAQARDQYHELGGRARPYSHAGSERDGLRDGAGGRDVAVGTGQCAPSASARRAPEIA